MSRSTRLPAVGALWWSARPCRRLRTTPSAGAGVAATVAPRSPPRHKEAARSAKLRTRLRPSELVARDDAQRRPLLFRLQDRRLPLPRQILQSWRPRAAPRGTLDAEDRP